MPRSTTQPAGLFCGCLIRSFRAAFFTGVSLGLALATVRFVAFPRADLDTLLALPRVAEFPLGSFPRFCTFDPFLRLAMIDPPVLVGAPQSIDAGSPSPGNLSNELSPDFRLSGPAWALFFLGRTGASRFATEGWNGGEVCRITSMPGSADQRMPSKKTARWGRRQSRRLRITDGFAVCALPMRH